MREFPVRMERWQELLAIAVAAAAGAGLFAGAELAVAGSWGFPLDDAWIHLQFARNLGAGLGFSFNPGEPSAGSTAPLWTLLMALLWQLPVNPLVGVKLLGVCLLLATAWLTRCLSRSAGLSAGWSLLAGLTVALTPRLLWASLSGMEVLLYAALATAGIRLHVESWERKPPLAGTALLALSALARPECLLLMPLAVVDRWRIEKSLGQLWRLHRFHLLLYGAILAPAVYHNLSVIGKPLPNTFYAKVGGYGLFGALADFAPSRIGRALLLNPVLQGQELVQFAVENSLLLAVAAPLGLLLFFRVSSRQHFSGSWLIPLTIISYPLVRGMLAPFKGPTFQHGRYAAHLIPLLTVVGLLGCREAWRLLVEGLAEGRTEQLRRWWRAGVWLLVIGNLLVVDLKYARTYGRNVADIERMHVTMGRWLAANTPKDALIATNDIGAIAFFSRRRLLDVVGLVTPDVLDYLQPGVAADKGVLRFLEKERPDYLVILPNWYPELSRRRDLFQPVYEVTLEGNTIAGGNRLVAYRTIWSD